MRKKASFSVIAILALGIIILIFLAIMYRNRIAKPADSLIGLGEDLISQASIVKFNFADTDIELYQQAASSSLPSASGTLSGNTHVEKVAQACRELGLDKEAAAIELKQTAQESAFWHCCETAGKNYAGSCKPTADKICDDSKILLSYDADKGRTSAGIRQLNRFVHPAWFDRTLCANPNSVETKKQQLECQIMKNAGCEGSTVHDVDCNIKVGILFMVALKNQAEKKDGLYFKCKNKTYKSWEAALRLYAGTGCAESMLDYVETIMSRKLTAEQQKALDSVYG